MHADLHAETTRALRINLPVTGPAIPMAKLCGALAGLGLVLRSRCNPDGSFDAVHSSADDLGPLAEPPTRCAHPDCDRLPAVRLDGIGYCGIHGSEQLTG